MSSIGNRLFALVLGAASLVAGASSALAQETEGDPATGHENLVTANPFGFVFEWYNVELEHKLSANTSLGFTASYISPGHDSLATGNAIFRFYPQGTAFKGFYFGGRAGAYFVDDFPDNGTFFGTGLEIGYTWLMGANKNWYLGMGAGVTRIFGGEFDGSAVVPQVRFVNFGYAF